MRRLGPPLGLLAICLLVALPAQAGAQQPQPEPKVVGGGTVSISNYPWQAALVFIPFYDAYAGFANDFDRQFCGGSFITSRIVQTAAHCIWDGDPDCGADGFVTTAACNGGNDPGGDGTIRMDANDFRVVGGKSTLSSAGGNYNALQAIYWSSGYNDNTFANDLAWLVLSSAHPVTASEQDIDIAGAGETAYWDTNSPTQVSGWGRTSQGGSYSDTLKAAVVPVVSDSDCADPISYGARFFGGAMVCAGVLAGGVDACQGDSGGPLVGPGAPARLVGVVSWGDGCALQNKPTIYSRIANTNVYNIQATVDFIESAGQQNLPDGGSVYGAGGAPVANGPGQSLIRPPAQTPVITNPVVPRTPTVVCPKGKKLKNGRCVKKKKKRRR